MLRRRKIAELDAFPKVDESYLEPSTSGASVTLFTAGLLLVLVLGELWDYRALHTEYEFLVDRRLHLNMVVNVDITVAMDCNYISVDVLDEAGAAIHARDALTLSPAYFHTFGAIPKRVSADPIHMDVNVRKLIQHAEDSTHIKTHAASTVSGCRINGGVLLNNVAGNFHITANGYTYGFIGDVAPPEKLNFSHRIDKFTFGRDYPGLKHPLSHSYDIIDKPATKMDYFLSIVPTIYIDRSENVILTNQYAVTDYKTTLNHQQGKHGTPGIFFKYDLEPVTIRIIETRRSFIRFLVRLCGIVGGVFVCAGMLHTLATNVWTNWVQGGQLSSTVTPMPRKKLFKD
ncbi:hypothetical protein RI367_002724 [Sorochytrium milnesiophthora]